MESVLRKDSETSVCVESEVRKEVKGKSKRQKVKGPRYDNPG